MSLSGWFELFPKQPHLGSNPAFSVFSPSLWPRDTAAPARPHGDARTWPAPCFHLSLLYASPPGLLAAPPSGISPLLAPSFAHVYIFCLCLTRIKKKKKKEPVPQASGRKASIFNSRGQKPSPSLHVGYFRARPQLTELQGSLQYRPRATRTSGARPQLCSCSAGAQLQAAAWERRPPPPPSVQPKAQGMNISLWKFVLPIHFPSVFTPLLWAWFFHLCRKMLSDFSKWPFQAYSDLSATLVDTLFQALVMQRAPF